AAPVAVGAGATVGGIDVSVNAGLTRARHIEGRVIDAATGQPAASASVMAIPRTPSPFLLIPTAQTTTDGRFDISGAVPGPYFVVAGNRSDGSLAMVDVGE